MNSTPYSVVAVDGRSRQVRSQVSLPALIYTYSSIAVDPGARVYVCDYNSGLITPVNISSSNLVPLPSFSGVSQYAEAVAVDPGSHLLYIVNSTGAVSILDGQGNQQNSITGLTMPTAIALDPSSTRAYIVDTAADNLRVLDTAKLLANGVIPLGVFAQGLAFDPTSARLYAANYLSGAVSVINPASQKVLSSWTSGKGTWSVAVDAGLQQVYAANSNDGTVSIFSAADGSLKGVVATGTTGTPDIKVNSITHSVYISGGGTLAVIDGNARRLAATIPVGNTPVGVALDEGANRIYIANQQDGTISVIDGGGNQVIATWNPQLDNVWKLAVDPSLGRLYISVPPPSMDSFTGLAVIDTSSGTLVAQIPGRFSAAEDVAVNPRTHHVFVSDSSSGTVTLIDGATYGILNIFVTGTAAGALAVDPASGLVYVSNPYDATIGVVADQPIY